MNTLLERRSVVAQLLHNRDQLLVVAGLGSPCYDVFAAGDHDLNFYDFGAMGSAAITGLGLALAKPEVPVLVITGDGEMLMGIGAFATITQHLPPNLSIVILDNEQYAETGMQRTATGYGVDLAGVARSCGIVNSETYSSDSAISGIREQIRSCSGTMVAVLKIQPGDQPRVMPERDGAIVTERFIKALESRM